MYQVKRAIIMAAGFGKRLQPITKEVPKPLIIVNGTRIIDTIIDSLHNNGINEIHVVVGYMKEKFSVLKEKYKDINIIENPYFDVCNNISSLYVARKYLDDVIILDGDQIIYNDEILTPFFTKSGYNAVWVDNKTDEWLLQVNNNKIINCSRDGGIHGWQLFSISRWNTEDGAKLKKHVEIEFCHKKNKDIYWDDVVMFAHFDEYDLGIKEMISKDIIEVDNLNELIKLDNSYSVYMQEDIKNG